MENLKVEIKCKTENQKALINSIKNNIFTIVNGLAGTGKTYLACAEALRLMVNDEKIKKIVLVKSITMFFIPSVLRTTNSDFSEGAILLSSFST